MEAMGRFIPCPTCEGRGEIEIEKELPGSRAIKECASPVCSTMICVKCGECPNRCGFDQGEPSPHDACLGNEINDRMRA